MYISKLHIRAFGKFLYKKLHLGKNLNIVYGENEAGKSTIHNFIEAMLYGFEDNEKGQSLYNKYKPWESGQYKGTLQIEGVEGKNYLIEKDFLLGTSQVFNKEDNNKLDLSMTEENILTTPGEFFFNMNKVSFRNTVSIRQLGNKTDKELSTELKNKIINLSNSRDESISIERILAALNQVKEESGSEENPKTLLGQYVIRLKELEKTKENVINSGRQVMFLAMEKKKLKSKIQELEMRIESLNKELNEYELSIEKDIFLRAEPVKNKLDEVNKEISLYKEDDIKIFSKNDYEEAIKLTSELNIMRGERNELQNKKDEAEIELIKLEEDISNNIPDDFEIDNINSYINNHVANSAKIKQLNEKISIGLDSIKDIDLSEINKVIDNFNKVKENNNKIEILNVFQNEDIYNKLINFKKNQNIKFYLLGFLGTLLMAAAIGAGYAAYYFNRSEFYGGILAALFGIYSYVSANKIKNKVKSTTNELESIECQRADNIKSISDLTDLNDEIIKENNNGNFDELKDDYEKRVNQKNIAEEKLKLIEYDKNVISNLEETNNDLEKKLKNNLKLFGFEEITLENGKLALEIFNRKDSVKENIKKYRDIISELNQSLSKVDKEISFEEKRLNMILNSNNMKNIEEFKKTVEYYEGYIDLKNKKDYSEKLLQSILVNYDYNLLKEKTKNVMFYDVKELDRKEHQLKIFKLNEEKNNIIINVNNIDREIEQIENSVREMAEVEEEIEFYEDKRNIFKEKIKVADLAAEKIVKISDSIKGNFMPLLRRTISENFSYLTGGKYKEVNIDENMNITVISRENEDMLIDIESLSGGTLDQLYLSLRIALSNILSGNENITIILDDSFVQYDSNRLKKSMEMLARESERRQVILFTCQEREVEYAKEMNLKFNLIKL